MSALTPRWLLASVTIAAIFLYADSATAQTVTACAGPQGQLRVVDAAGGCRPSETVLTWNLQGPKGDPGEPGAPGEPGPAGSAGSGFLIADAHDQVVGPYLPESSRVMFHSSEDAWVMVKIGQAFTGITTAGPSGPMFFFALPNCAGTPYMQRPVVNALTVDGSVMSNFPGFAAGLHAVYARPPYQVLTFASRFATAAPVGGPYECTNGTFTAGAGEAGAIALNGFTPPFRIVLP